MPFKPWFRRTVVIAVAIGAGLGGTLAVTAASASPVHSSSPQWPGQSQDDWSMRGQNYSNTMSQPGDDLINPSDVANLKVKWTYTAAGDISATPAVVGRYVYVPDWGGNLTKLDARSGKVVWSYPVSDYNGVPGSLSRTSPAVVGNTIYIGDQNKPGFGGVAHFMAVNATTGKKEWSTVVDTHPLAVVTGSPVVYDGVVYVGIASKEQAAASEPGYPCCTFRGSEIALNAKTGAILWKDYMSLAQWRAARRVQRRRRVGHPCGRPGNRHALRHHRQQLHPACVGHHLRERWRHPGAVHARRQLPDIDHGH